MLFVLISSLPFFLLLCKSFPVNSLPSWAIELLWEDLCCLLARLMRDNGLSSSRAFKSTSAMATKKKCAGVRVENAEEPMEMPILDLPELTLECILGKLSPAGLRSMAGVCSSLRDRCRSDYLWERHMKERWSRVIGSAAARREWQWYLAMKKNSSSASAEGGKSRRWIRSLACLWPFSLLTSQVAGDSKPSSPLPDDSIMSWYLSLESGKFWFPAQVYNREHGHVGFVLSCYDAELCYDRHTDTFQARYPPHGRRTIVIEEGVQWNRIRGQPIDGSAHDLHVSDCLNDLHPGDHIEIQWRMNKEYPYGWWYGVVGHLESCDGNGRFCRCSASDTVILEFNHYTPGSKWRRAIISRKSHQEEGNETNGFYGGIRKLYNKDEISAWRHLWPTEILE